MLAYYHPLMAEAFKRFPSDEWVEVARQAGVPLQPVRTPEEALFDPALEAEGAVDRPRASRARSAAPGRDPLRAQQDPGPGPGPGAGGRRAHRGGPRRSSPLDQARATCRRRPSPTPRSMVGPLAGITVLDLGFAVAGPFGAQVLADLGAERHQGEHLARPVVARLAHRLRRQPQQAQHRHRPEDPRGAGGLPHLASRSADVVHSNMRRDALRRLKCDEESLRAVNPDLIYCHTRGFDRGPRSDSPGNDQTGCSLAGVTLRGRRLRRRGPTVLEPHLTRRHRQRLLLGDRRDPGAVSPRAHGRGAERRHLDPERRHARRLDGRGEGRRHQPARSRSWTPCNSASARTTGCTRRRDGWLCLRRDRASEHRQRAGDDHAQRDGLGGDGSTVPDRRSRRSKPSMPQAFRARSPTTTSRCTSSTIRR